MAVPRLLSPLLTHPSLRVRPPPPPPPGSSLAATSGNALVLLPSQLGTKEEQQAQHEVRRWRAGAVRRAGG